MDAKAGPAESVADTEHAPSIEGRAILDWYRATARPFLKQSAPDHLSALDNDAERLSRLLARPDHVTVCFLGHSGIGKSTLLNAVAAGRDQVLPAGGIGPLTAQATEVHFSEVPSFKVYYQTRAHLWRIAFALERAQERAMGNLDPTPNRNPADKFTVAVQDEVLAEVEQADIPGAESTGSVYAKQATQIVAGDQFEQRSHTYLIDCLRIACGQKTNWDTQIEGTDLERIYRVQSALQLAETERPYHRSSAIDRHEFFRDLKDHAAGFLAPLIRSIEVGWPSEMLRAGVKLVDLPGVGIAQDTYRRVTKGFIREQARAVVLVVDKSGPTGRDSRSPQE